MTDGRRRLPGWLRVGGVKLADADMADEAAPLIPGPVHAAGRRIRGMWRWWMWLPVLSVLVGVALVAPAPGDVVRPSVVGDVARWVDVTLPRSGEGDAQVSGVVLAPGRDDEPSLAVWLLALLPGGTSAVAPAPALINGFDPVQVAMLTGSGSAPGRVDFVQTGMAASVASGRHSPAQVAVGLLLFDATSGVDVLAGRRVLVLGSLQLDGTIACAARPAASLSAVAGDPPDVVLVGRGCLTPDASGVMVLEAVDLLDAVAALGRHE